MSNGDLLLCLYGLVLSHIVPGDVAFSHGVQTTSLPPVTILEGGGGGRRREGEGREVNVVYSMGEWETQYHNSMLPQFLGPAPLNPKSPVSGSTWALMISNFSPFLKVKSSLVRCS